MAKPGINDKLLNEVEALVVAQVSSGKIQTELARKFDVKPRTVRKYISLVEDRWASEQEDEAKKGRQKYKVRASMRHLFQRCLAKGDLKTARLVLLDMCRLDGLFEPKQIVITDDAAALERIRQMTTDERRRRVEELLGDGASKEMVASLADKLEQPHAEA